VSMVQLKANCWCSKDIRIYSDSHAMGEVLRADAGRRRQVEQWRQCVIGLINKCDFLEWACI